MLEKIEDTKEKLCGSNAVIDNGQMLHQINKWLDSDRAVERVYYFLLGYRETHYR